MADDFRLPFDEAISFFRQKLSLPSKTWRDIEGRSHDRGFVVAGAIKQQLIEDLRRAMDDALAAGGGSLRAFTERFEQIVGQHGWTGWTGEGSDAGRAWRARVIYETNLRTAYAAGRYRQMTDPDVLKVYRWWRYRHAYYRSPERPRLEHQAMDGQVWRADDPVWDTIYPPNGWNCGCGVEPMSAEDLADEGITPPEHHAAPLPTRPVTDPRTGETVRVPVGIDFGWDHAPGRDWARGIVPPALAHPLRGPERRVVLDANLPSLAKTAKPFSSPLLKPGLAKDEYVDAFLAEFGASMANPVVWRDPSGHAVVISDSLFRDGQGRLKVMFNGRNEHVLRLAEAIRDPDEIWVDWAQGVNGAPRLVRRYLRSSPDSPEFASFIWGTEGWSGATAFHPQKGSALKPDPAYLERQRQGALLWRRGT